MWYNTELIFPENTSSILPSVFSFLFTSPLCTSAPQQSSLFSRCLGKSCNKTLFTRSQAHLLPYVRLTTPFHLPIPVSIHPSAVELVIFGPCLPPESILQGKKNNFLTHSSTALSICLKNEPLKNLQSSSWNGTHPRWRRAWCRSWAGWAVVSSLSRTCKSWWAVKTNNRWEIKVFILFLLKWLFSPQMVSGKTVWYLFYILLKRTRVILYY